MFGTYLGCRAGAALRSGGSRFPIMPLRAKVINPAFGGRAQMATASDVPSEGISYAQAENIKELESDEKEDVLFNTLYGVRTIELNRPAKLHSLNGSMIRKIVPRLQEWSKSDMANVIIIKGSGPKAFCAGGDVVALAEDNTKGPEGQARSTDYFGLEYKLDHLIATYQKPYIAFHGWHYDGRWGWIEHTCSISNSYRKGLYSPCQKLRLDSSRMLELHSFYLGWPDLSEHTSH
ncbi:hypothetical protein EYC84_008426 [Monilinia fructicola]|uniref:3-hydroxyisobutyryl-CoA hydrolase n=1 Tax=Monilinia fructicola TaxID=38448 RepID=A0A5M9JFB0_MONFR|nr:hypothetical protein EYC84_008426 [Monilinia fructicola]